MLPIDTSKPFIEMLPTDIPKPFITTTPYIITTPKPISKLNIPPLDVQQERLTQSVDHQTLQRSHHFPQQCQNTQIGAQMSQQVSQSVLQNVNQSVTNIPNITSGSVKCEMANSPTLPFPEKVEKEKKEVRIPILQQNTKAPKEKKKPDWERLKQLSKTNEACQQAVFIGLLNMFGYEIGIERVYKISKKTFPLLTINFVHKYTKDGIVDMDITVMAQRMSEEMLKSSSVEDKKKRRQHKRNMDASICNSLMTYLEKEGVKFDLKGTRSAQFTMIMKKVRDVDLVLFNKHRRISQKELVNIGKYVNNHLVKMMGGMKRRAVSSEKYIKVEPFETTITGIFLSHFNGLLIEFDDSTKCVDIDNDVHQDLQDTSMTYHTLSNLQPSYASKKLKYPLEFYAFVRQDVLDFIHSTFS
ncbi:hypothetical protein EIN_046830 [Entamoeba invadens IP1]|uniref:Uncharacterized protein n=1 Tax=Entamoeba invadens IP1 TaxID=370355 RepID=A0A0A1UH18_ENTIV|nr:hypothetical protein EIN_046830 [Entamoeba invadens IP1]ELP94420.1 hypothetical protein EIN_046830 [Entamoeba invadens IP1]|eukprot:XP_004261191.1 hypothetical protein EIN_046830 [Entamoeba invadens IP1]